MLAIGVIELVALFAGFSPSGAIESALPDLDLHADVDLHAHVDLPADAPHIETGGPLSQVLGWLSFGRLPLLALLVIFLGCFSAAGFGVQMLATRLAGAPLGAGLAAIPALVIGAYGMRYLGRWIGRLMPPDQTEAASQKELIGGTATIIRGIARRGAPAEAKVRDRRGRFHYVLVEPDGEDEVFEAGSEVIVLRQHGSIYRAVTTVAER